MSDATTLVIPIRVDALVVGTVPPKDFQWTNLTPNFYLFEKDYKLGSDEDLYKLFREADRNFFMPPGIHLHFRLPRAFTHGTQQGSGGLSFPRIPNRWLVQRTCQAANKKLSHKAWLIKSDAEAGKPWSSSNPGVIWPSFVEGQPAVFKSIGQCTEVTGRIADADESAALDPKAPELTAVGPGDPSFSAYYPACRSVLGFYDTLDGVPAGTHPSYLVTGWYSLAADDPLFTAEWRTGKISADAEKSFRKKNNIPENPELSTEQRAKLLSELRDAWLEERKWACIALVAAQSPPTRLVCHGLVRSVGWEGKEQNYLQPVKKPESERVVEVFPLNTDDHNTAYQIAVGESPGEALAALFADGEVDQDLLTALQGGLLFQDTTISDLGNQLHGGRFRGVRGGTVFLIQPAPDDTLSQAGRPPAPRTDAGVLPEQLRNLLRDLNEKQATFDRQSRRVDDCIWQLYACWYLWTAECRGPGINSDSAKQRKSQLDAFTKLLDGEKQSLVTAKSARDGCKKSIEDELSGTAELMYRLTESVLRPFEEPNDPILAIAGPAMARLNTWQQTTEALPCRLSDKLVTDFDLRVPGGDKAKVTFDDLARTLFATVPDPGGIHGDLLRESLLLDPQNAEVIAAKADPTLKHAVAKLLQDAESAGGAVNSSTNVTICGDLPFRPGGYDWNGNPWIPLFLVWEVSWQSDYPSDTDAVIAADAIAKRWTLALGAGGDGGPDLMLRKEAAGTPRAGGSVPTKYQGRSILTPSASKSLAEKLVEWQKDQGQSKEHPLIGQLKFRSVMSQALDGFHEALTQRRSGIQLPPLGYARPPYKLDPISEKLSAGVGADQSRMTFRTTPATKAGPGTKVLMDGPFLPIRTGLLKIEQLSVVDAFGQTVKLPVDEINSKADKMLHRAHNTIVSGSQPAEVVLRPRFTRPMRLHFEFESTGSAPVCGWVLPNHMEQSLAIYSATGRPLGAFQKRLIPQAGDSGFYWVPFPRQGNNSSIDAASLESVVADAHLLYFCKWLRDLIADQGDLFSDLINQSIEATDQRVPDEDPGVSVLVGRPLALVRASLQFKVPGVPVHSPGLLAMPSEPKTVEECIVTRSFEKVLWPVRLGDLRARNDGLVGVFASDSSGKPSGPFYPAWGEDQGGAVKDKFRTQDFTLDCCAPLRVTMLMDPQARVHAATGALPRVHVELPLDLASGAKRAREVFFQTAPVLGESTTPHMPRPSDDYGEWSWAYRPDVTNWREDPNLVEATDRGIFSGAWPAIAEGWLKLRIAPVKVLSLWVLEGTEEVPRGANIHLAWSLQSAETLELQSVSEDGQNVVTIEQWQSPPFPREYGVTIQAPTTYRLTATAEGAKPSTKNITIALKSS